VELTYLFLMLIIFVFFAIGTYFIEYKNYY
jgi:uncharacterized protein (UPF0333 family)